RRSKRRCLRYHRVEPDPAEHVQHYCTPLQSREDDKVSGSRWMSRRTRLSAKGAVAFAALAMTIYVVPTDSGAADADGNYYIGGAVGGRKCPWFLNAMTEARQLGGLHSITGGAYRVEEWEGYVLGFETGYNLGAPGIVDVFASLGRSEDERVDNALYW